MTAANNSPVDHDDVVSLPDDDDARPPYAQEFLDFIDEATSVYHSTAYFARTLEEAGFEYIKESDVRFKYLHLLCHLKLDLYRTGHRCFNQAGNITSSARHP